MSEATAVVIGVGAERGLGAALCRRFAAEGHHVLVAGRTPSKLEQVAKANESAGGSAELIRDRFPQAIERLGEDGMLGIDAIAETYGQIHRQHRSAWTHEVDLRPFKEAF